MDFPTADLASLWLDADPETSPGSVSTAHDDERPVAEAWADLEERVNAARAVL
jgi:hypothetical protein